MTVTRDFRCFACGRVDRYEIGSEPMHCGKLMKPGPLDNDNKKADFRVDLVKLKAENPRYVENAAWSDQWEVWLLWAGRKRSPGDSLYIGVLGQGMIGWSWVMAPGYTPETGFKGERNEAVGEMVMIATQGDV